MGIFSLKSINHEYIPIVPYLLFKDETCRQAPPLFADRLVSGRVNPQFSIRLQGVYRLVYKYRPRDFSSRNQEVDDNQNDYIDEDYGDQDIYSSPPVGYITRIDT